MKVKNIQYYIENHGVKNKLLSLLFELYAKNGDVIAN